MLSKTFHAAEACSLTQLRLMQAAHGGHDAHMEFLKIPITLPQVKLTVDRHACCWDFVKGVHDCPYREQTLHKCSLACP